MVCRNLRGSAVLGDTFHVSVLVVIVIQRNYYSHFKEHFGVKYHRSTTLTLNLYVYLCPAIVKGVIGLYASKSLNPIKSTQCVHLPPMNRHLVSPAPSCQSLNLDPLVQGAIIFPNITLRLFTSCINRSMRENCQQMYRQASIPKPVSLNL